MHYLLTNARSPSVGVCVFAYLPQAPKLRLPDPQKFTELPGDDGGVPWRVVQNGLSKSCADAQRTDGDGILTWERAQGALFEG